MAMTDAEFENKKGRFAYLTIRNKSRSESEEIEWQELKRSVPREKDRRALTPKHHPPTEYENPMPTIIREAKMKSKTQFELAKSQLANKVLAAVKEFEAAQPSVTVLAFDVPALKMEIGSMEDAVKTEPADES